MLNLILFILQTLNFPHAKSVEYHYSPRGVGGGGALSGLSMSPYTDLRFVGTDMGTLFRSLNKGKSWIPVSHAYVKFNSDLDVASEVGFSSDGKTVFYADAGREPKRSKDAGETWSSIPVPLLEGERIRYWVGDSQDAKFILCATTEGLIRSKDHGTTWKRIDSIQGQSRGTVILREGNKNKIFHATEAAIVTSENQGDSFKKYFTPSGTQIRSFTGGIDAKGQTLAFIDSRGKEACSWAKGASDASDEEKKSTYEECGFVWIQSGKGDFTQTRKEGGRYIRMAENDSQTIYVTGGKWVRQYGSKIWVSRDSGKNWNLRLHTYDWDKRPYQPWPKDKLEYSAVGVDVGWDDNAPFSFAVNRRNSAEAGTTGHYFLHMTKNHGERWEAPFTEFADKGERTRGKKWKSTGLEVTSALKLKFHPRNTKLGYVSVADIGGYVTEDGGESWRISKVKYNTNYDYAFDPEKPNRAYAASGNRHDFPLNIDTPIHGEGGVFVSDDRGHSWKRLTPESKTFNRQFLSVAYDPANKTLYAGTQGGGIARSKNDGKQWEYINAGLPDSELVIPQLEVDSKSGTVYALLTGNAPEFKNSDSTGIYRFSPGSTRWELLRKTVNRPKDVELQHSLWNFPSSFAVDFSKPGRDTLWLTDIEKKGAWLASGVWKSSDSGKTWNRMTQFTHPTAITIDPKNSQNIYVSGLYDVSGNWGKGGAIYSTDSGVSWKKNEKLPLLTNLFNFTPDPNHPEKGFYLFFGGGMLYGTKPL